MLPAEAESQFTKVVRTRIVGEARRTIQGEEFDTIAKLTKYLEDVFGEPKNIYQLQGELGRIYQRNTEDVITFANRLKIIGKQILECHKRTGTATPAVKASLQKDMCKCFIRGLKPEIEQRVGRDLDIHGTVSNTINIERELQEMCKLRKDNFSNTNRLPEFCQTCNREGHSTSTCRNLGTEILICQICKKRGHSADKCRLRDSSNRRSINVIKGNQLICQLCSKIGHTARNCKANINNKPSVICQWCDKTGHSAQNCWKKQNEPGNIDSRSKIICQNCSNYGHTIKECRFKAKESSMSKSSLFCRYCKKEGHLLETCQLRAINNDRRRLNNSGNQIGSSKTGVVERTERISRPSTSQKS